MQIREYSRGMVRSLATQQGEVREFRTRNQMKKRIRSESSINEATKKNWAVEWRLQSRGGEQGSVAIYAQPSELKRGYEMHVCDIRMIGSEESNSHKLCYWQVYKLGRMPKLPSCHQWQVTSEPEVRQSLTFPSIHLSLLQVSSLVHQEVCFGTFLINAYGPLISSYGSDKMLISTDKIL